MDDNVFWIKAWQLIITGAVLIGLTIAGCHSYETKRFIENGYTKMMLPGSNISQWVKSIEEKK